MRTISVSFLLLVCSGVPAYFASAAQDVAAPTLVHREEAFLLDNECFEPSDDWVALFCNREDVRRCAALKIAITESKCCRETLGNGEVVPTFDYVSRPGQRLFMLVKGLQVKEGPISNILAQRLPLVEEPQPVPEEPLSVVLGTETYQLRIDGLNLLIEERGKTIAKQTVPVFIDPKSSAITKNDPFALRKTDPR
jgi:hypothetical protein